jgi:RNA polymerase sigma-70 factor (ECF subfamily)
MVAIAHSVIGDRHLAEDAAQQAFAKAATSLAKLRQTEKFGGWIAAICRNAAKDVARSRREVPAEFEREAVRTEPGGDEDVQAVRAAMEKLSDVGREVIYLRFYDGLSYDRISAVLGISEQAINGRLRRAKRKLAGHLRRAGFGEVRL